MLLLITAYDWEQNPTANLCSRCTAKIQKVKQRVSAVACFTQHVEVIWVQTDRTRHMPSFLEKKGAGNGSLETGIQVDLSDQCLAVEWISVPTRGNQTLSQRRGTWTRSKGRVGLKRLPGRRCDSRGLMCNRFGEHSPACSPPPRHGFPISFLFIYQGIQSGLSL